MSRNFFEEVKKVIRDQTKQTPGTVSNLHGVVQEAVVTREETVQGQNWFVLSAQLQKLPTLREFMDAVSLQRLPLVEVSAIENRANFPASGTLPVGHAVAFYAVAKAGSATQLSLQITAPGHSISVYVGDALVASGVGALTRSVPIPAGDTTVTILAHGGTAPLTVETDGSVPFVRGEPTPQAPLAGVNAVVSYLNASNGSYRVGLEWQNDASASAWGVYRAPFLPLGVPTTVTAPNTTEMVLRFATAAVFGQVGDGAPVVVNDFLAGVVSNVAAVRDVNGVLTHFDVTVALVPSAPTLTSAYTGQQVRVSSEVYNALGRVSFGGDPIIRYSDTAVFENEWYSYRLTAFGFLTGTSESDYSTPMVVRVLDTTVPGSITATVATDLTVVNGEATLKFTAPADADYRGVKVFRGTTLITQAFGLPGQLDRLVFRPDIAGTFEFRTFDWAGNVQAQGAGVSWTWDGNGNWVDGIIGALAATVQSNNTVDLTLVLNGPGVAYPATVSFYKDQLTTPMTLTGAVTQLTVSGDSTVTKATNTALGGIALPMNTVQQYWAKVTDKDGKVKWFNSGAVSRVASVRPSGTADLSVAPLTGIVTLNVKAVLAGSFAYTSSLTAFDLTGAKTAGTFSSGAASVALATALTNGQTRYITVWFYENTAQGGAISEPVTVKITYAPTVPKFEFLQAVIDTGAADQPRYDMKAKIVDPSGLGGKLYIWVSKNGTASTDPNVAADAYADVTAGSSFTADSSTMFKNVTTNVNIDTLLNNVRGNAKEPKVTYFEFINTMGISTGKVAFPVSGPIGVIQTDGSLGPQTIGTVNLIPSIRPPRHYVTRPAANALSAGDVIFESSTGLLLKTDGVSTWSTAVDADNLMAHSGTFGMLAATSANFSQVVADHLTAGAIDAGKISVAELSDFTATGPGGTIGLGIIVGGRLNAKTLDGSGNPIAFLDLNATGTGAVLSAQALTLGADGTGAFSGNVSAESVTASVLTGTLMQTPRLEATEVVFTRANTANATWGTYTTAAVGATNASDATWVVASTNASRTSNGTTVGAETRNVLAGTLPGTNNEYTVRFDLSLDTSTMTIVGVPRPSEANVDGVANVYYRLSSGGALQFLFSRNINHYYYAEINQTVNGQPGADTMSVTQLVTIPGVTTYLEIVVVPSTSWSSTGDVDGTATTSVTGTDVAWVTGGTAGVTRQTLRLFASTTSGFSPALVVEPMGSMPTAGDGRAGDIINYAGSLYVHNGTGWVIAGQGAIPATYDWTQITNKPATATRWPAFSEVTGSVDLTQLPIVSTAKGGTGVDNSTGGTAGTFWARPAAAAGAATYRALVISDIPLITTAKGGTGVDNSTGGTAGHVFARPSAAAGAAAFRALVESDIPTLTIGTKTSGNLTADRGGTGMSGANPFVAANRVVVSTNATALTVIPLYAPANNGFLRQNASGVPAFARIVWGDVDSKPTTIYDAGWTNLRLNSTRSSADLNTHRSSGFLAIESSPTNAVYAYAPLIVADNSDVGLQISGGYNSDNLYFRGWYNTTTFSAWRTVLHSGNFASYAVSLTGGSVINGTLTVNNTLTLGYRLYMDGGGFLASNAGSFYFYNASSGAQLVRVGGLVSSDNYSDTAPASGIYSKGNITSSGSINTTSGSGYQLDGTSRLYESGNYTYLQAGDAVGYIALGKNDLANYHQNATHYFRNRSSTVQATISDTGLIVQEGIYARSQVYVNGTGALNTGYYGYGLVGRYSDVRYQGVFAMDSAYVLSADGTTPGTLYGLAWTHTNIGGQSKPGLSHQLLVMEGGVTKVALGTGIWTSGVITAAGGIHLPSGQKLYSEGDTTNYYIKSTGGVLDIHWYYGVTVDVANGRALTINNDKTAAFGSTLTATDFVLASDARLKDDILPLTDALTKIAEVSGYTFTYKHTPTTRRAGVLAQEIQQILPEAVITQPDGMLAVSYDAIVPLLIEAVKELSTRVKELEGR